MHEKILFAIFQVNTNIFCSDFPSNLQNDVSLGDFAIDPDHAEALPGTKYGAMPQTTLIDSRSNACHIRFPNF